MILLLLIHNFSIYSMLLHKLLTDFMYFLQFLSRFFSEIRYKICIIVREKNQCVKHATHTSPKHDTPITSTNICTLPIFRTWPTQVILLELSWMSSQPWGQSLKLVEIILAWSEFWFDDVHWGTVSFTRPQDALRQLIDRLESGPLPRHLVKVHRSVRTKRGRVRRRSSVVIHLRSDVWFFGTLEDFVRS